jgi:hypothetical protein
MKLNKNKNFKTRSRKKIETKRKEIKYKKNNNWGTTFKI